LGVCGTLAGNNPNVINTANRNEALAFDGLDDLVTIPNNGSPLNSLSTQFTVEAFMRSDGAGPEGWMATTLVSNRQPHPTTGQVRGLLFTLYTGHMLLQLDGMNYGHDQAATLVPADGQSHHVAVSRDQNNQVRFYLDGQAVAYSPVTARSPGSTADWRIGGDSPYGEASSSASSRSSGSTAEWRISGDNSSYGEGYFREFFTGHIGEVRIWNAARTPQQIRQSMTSRLNPQSGLVAYYDMQDAAASGSLVDLSGNFATANRGLLPTAETADPTWMTRCAIPSAVQGNFRLAAGTSTAPAARYGATQPDTTGQARSATAIPLQASRLEASLYPNPASGTVLLRFEQPVAGLVRVRVLDMLGLEKTRLEQAAPTTPGPRTLTLPLHKLPAGPYVVEIQTPGARHTLRLAVQ
ncbi:T9SS C-terminal target domain-containing protein, partial [Hymenobacter lapidiphilus]|uniref:LamG-like jellyroll fold domain-containing protein n=1 Tax=Hymenobacter sp. CCM 8763 TaxID=2303334 RepID=UPI000E34642A